jgi:uncharacterized membrane protein
LEKDRLAAFSDGVIAIIITIMVLELKAPHGSTWDALTPLLPSFLSYVLSFLYVAIYWNNHHHMLHTVKHVNGSILWANMHLLFWLSLIPFATAWMGENRFRAMPTALYGMSLLMAAFAYLVLERVIVRAQGANSLLARAVEFGWKEKASLVLYLSAIGLSFVHPVISRFFYAIVALMWLIPDQRIERVLRKL